jgi:hypothetical protein
MRGVGVGVVLATELKADAPPLFEGVLEAEPELAAVTVAPEAAPAALGVASGNSIDCTITKQTLHTRAFTSLNLPMLWVCDEHTAQYTPPAIHAHHHINKCHSDSHL